VAVVSPAVAAVAAVSVAGKRPWQNTKNTVFEPLALLVITSNKKAAA